MVKILREREIKQNNRTIKELKKEKDTEVAEKEELLAALSITKDEIEEYEFYIKTLEQSMDKLSPDSKEYHEKKRLLSKHDDRLSELGIMKFEVRRDIQLCDEYIDKLKSEITQLKHENAVKRGTYTPPPKHTIPRFEKLLPEFGVIC